MLWLIDISSFLGGFVAVGGGRVLASLIFKCKFFTMASLPKAGQALPPQGGNRGETG